jgi:hypothetical protein
MPRLHILPSILPVLCVYLNSAVMDADSNLYRSYYVPYKWSARGMTHAGQSLSHSAKPLETLAATFRLAVHHSIEPYSQPTA